MRIKLFEKGKIIIYGLIILTGIYLSVSFSEEVYRGIHQGIALCCDVLVPSLFFLMVIAAFTVHSSVALYITRPLRGISRVCFSLPYVCMTPILLSLIGGYPVGARCVSILFKSGMITRDQAKKASYIAVSAGPGFLINYIALALLNHRESGVILLTSEIISVIITGVIVSKTVKCEKDPPKGTLRATSSSLLIDSVEDASKGVFSMCSMVLMFSSLTEILKSALGGHETILLILSNLLEITTGSNLSAGKIPLYLTAFFVGFSSLSVHCQIYAVLKDVRPHIGLFTLFRVLQGIIASLATYILVSIFPETAAVFSTAEVTEAPRITSTVWGSLALVLSSLFFLGSVTQGGNYVLNRRNHDRSHRSVR